MVSISESPRKKQQRSLGREIVWLLAFKAVALAVLYFVFFGPSHRIHVTANQVAAALVGSAQINERP
ncbi:MAG: cytochrome oxidase putative small subunit CydP [Beijerinckiaceae bacterium]